MNARASKKDLAQRAPSRDVISRLQEVWGASPFYQVRLKGPAPDRLLFQPNDPFTPDLEAARAFAKGRLALGDEAIDCEGELERYWQEASASGAAFRFLQEFSWMRLLKALGDEGDGVARQLTAAWLNRYERWSGEVWKPDLVAERLVYLCAYAPMLLSGADPLWRSRVLSAMARQTRHLAHTAHRADTGYDRLMTALGLALAGYCLPGCEGPAERGLEMTRRELRLQLRADGGHASRNPSRQIKLALRLLAVQQALEHRNRPAPGFLRHCVARVAAMAEFFRCGDGKLVVFNGGYEDDPRAVLQAVKSVDQESAPTGFARHSGYHKLSAGRAMLMVDTGNEKAVGRFESAASLHFSSGRARLLVNCGNGAHRGREWRRALEARSAHTSLSFADPRQISFGPLSHRRAEENKGQLLEVERAVYFAQREEGLYAKRLFLKAGGGDLRGEEILEALPADAVSGATWRFHLHPSVRASLARDKKSVILLLSNKEGWRFKAACAAMSIEKSVYCGEGGSPCPTEQIVIYGHDLPKENGTTRLRWALRRQEAG